MCPPAQGSCIGFVVTLLAEGFLGTHNRGSRVWDLGV